MENKYYTPTIEEFHVGFEFETCYLEKEWITKKLTFDDFGFYTSTWEVDSTPKTEFRVKYLDQEDIESLGWKPHKEIQHYYKAPCNNFVLRIKYKKLCIYIYDEYTVDKLIFEGTIKNKSELKKLLKQLKIIE